MKNLVRMALCDDNAESLNVLDGFISDYAGGHGIHIRTERFSNGDDLVRTADEGEKYDIIFMDIYLGDENDSETGTDIIRRLNSDARKQVVFMTTSREHAIEAFSLNAAHYLIKPLTYPLVSEALDRCIERISSSESNTLDIKTKHGIVSIPTDNIQYIEVSNKQSTIHTSKSLFNTYMSLDSLFEMLDNNTFMKAQRSYIVNMGYIEELLFDRLIL